eukprot:scaffold2987_cov36-Prasinocladus_malaysianus.AAC.1
MSKCCKIASSKADISRKVEKPRVHEDDRLLVSGHPMGHLNVVFRDAVDDALESVDDGPVAPGADLPQHVLGHAHPLEGIVP